MYSKNKDLGKERNGQFEMEEHLQARLLLPARHRPRYCKSISGPVRVLWPAHR